MAISGQSLLAATGQILLAADSAPPAVPGLTVIYKAFTDPGVSGGYESEAEAAGRVPLHQCDAKRVRVYLVA
jgi:hypothetical protein